jgi:hypothetical protein
MSKTNLKAFNLSDINHSLLVIINNVLFLPMQHVAFSEPRRGQGSKAMATAREHRPSTLSSLFAQDTWHIFVLVACRNEGGRRFSSRSWCKGTKKTSKSQDTI